MKSIKLLFTLSLLFLFASSLQAQQIHGTIRNKQGELMPFATVWVSNQNKGTTANEDGKYSIKTGVGKHNLVFRFLGHSPKTYTVELESASSDKLLDVVLEEQAVNLAEVNVGGLKEDPAIGIMRRMIAMAPFHLKELDSYEAKAYVKGSGKVTEVSSLVKMLGGKKIEKEMGVKVGSTYLLEGINQVTYQKPNRLQEKVISNRNNLPPALNQGLNLRVTQTNFYRPKVWGSLWSPFGPQAFQLYKFAYLGGFTQDGMTISKIQVQPKASYDDLFEGTLQVVEDTWSIYSFQLRFKDSNGSYGFTQQNALFQGVWMPIQYDSQVNFDAFGIKANFRYITQIKQYQIKVNPAFVVKPALIEERLNKELAKEINKEKVKDPKNALGKELTRKKLKEVLKKVDKLEKKENLAKMDGLTSDYTFEVDSMSRNKSESFWEEERQVPLTESEKVGYKEADSLWIAGADKRRKDSINALPKFQFGQLFTGKFYNYEKNSIGKSFNLNGFGAGFNAVDGLYLDRSLTYRNRFGRNNYLALGGNIRYAFARHFWNGDVFLERNFDENRQYFKAEAGSNVFQMNRSNPISSFLNSLYALILSENYVKLFQKNYVNFNYQYQFTPSLRFLSMMEYRNREILTNSVNHGLLNQDKHFEANMPVNEAWGNQIPKRGNQLAGSIGFRWQPKASWNRYNGVRRINNGEGPTFTLIYAVGTGDDQFQRINLEYSQFVNLARLGTLNLQMTYVNYFQRATNFLDYTHFNGNQTNFISANEQSFRALPYYAFSTTDNHLKMHAKWEPRKLLFSQWNLLTQYGIREYVVYNRLQMLQGANQSAYQELVYGVSGIGKFLGVELAYPVGNWVPERFKLLLRFPF
ncbi:DUF5686 and carboxypeptidase regulatory-like domain-containing protein [Aquirufa ecclesiirivi]|uniref:DUF5686 and carboxypeptidase regulatory-like domain-containing protein n=1 Tax=Aquirufa ecclesiirivi TaxID=2715124 RepID=UPI0023D7D121|nr:DUF5686 and carboxypeptidase regulatory-like domain-containing protein [Aquirufa ecclesiirivi]MDF0693742.1 DUF5686 and carboxypeptidase regulatory-like domain-containing protein [Aquirufa ecclesiirivi]